MTHWRCLSGWLPHLPTFIAFGIIQIAQMVLPLLALPYLARVVGPEPFGNILYMLTVSAVVAVCVEWGFAMSAVRDVALQRHNQEGMANAVGGILGAKCMLAVTAAAIAAAGWIVLPLAQQHPFGYALAVANGIILGFSPLWFYQGTGTGVTRVAVFEALSGLFVLLLMLPLVKRPEDWSRYLLLLLLMRMLAYAWLMITPVRLVRGTSLCLKAAMHSIIKATPLFLARLGALGNTHGLTLIMGSILPTDKLALLIASDKIARCVVSLTTPAVQTLFPELCATRDCLTARRMAHRIALYTGMAMGLAGALLWIAAPLVIGLALGDGYAAAVPLLRVLCLLVPLLAVNASLAAHGFVACGHERALTAVMCIVAVPALAATPALVHAFGVTAGAWLPVCMESSILLLFAVLLWRQHNATRVQRRHSTIPQQARPD